MRNFSSFFFLHPLFLFLSLYQIGSEAENDYIHSRIQDVSSSEAPRSILFFSVRPTNLRCILVNLFLAVCIFSNAEFCWTRFPTIETFYLHILVCFPPLDLLFLPMIQFPSSLLSSFLSSFLSASSISPPCALFSNRPPPTPRATTLGLVPWTSMKKARSRGLGPRNWSKASCFGLAV